VLGVTALGISVAQARAKAYAAVDHIALPGKQVRRDIGARQ
jgi:phosphoribosylamine-glycine ligase